MPDILTYRVRYMNFLMEGNFRPTIEFQPIDLSIQARLRQTLKHFYAYSKNIMSNPVSSSKCPLSRAGRIPLCDSNIDKDFTRWSASPLLVDKFSPGFDFFELFEVFERSTRYLSHNQHLT